MPALPPNASKMVWGFSFMSRGAYPEGRTCAHNGESPSICLAATKGDQRALCLTGAYQTVIIAAPETLMSTEIQVSFRGLGSRESPQETGEIIMLNWKPLLLLAAIAATLTLVACGDKDGDSGLDDQGAHRLY